MLKRTQEKFTIKAINIVVQIQDTASSKHGLKNAKDYYCEFELRYS